MGKWIAPVRSLLASACVVAGACSPSDGAGNDPGRPNAPPVISGIPPTTAAVGLHWQFQPIASDPDGDRLYFSASGLPGWMNINASTGLVSGTPGQGDIGLTPTIVVSVRDARASASLPGFSVDVSPVPGGSGEAMLTWERPTHFTDGRELSMDALAYYRVYQGNSTIALGSFFNVPATGTSVLVSGLPPGTHCFAVSAITVTNIESALSNVGCKRVD